MCAPLWDQRQYRHYSSATRLSIRNCACASSVRREKKNQNIRSMVGRTRWNRSYLAVRPFRLGWAGSLVTLARRQRPVQRPSSVVRRRRCALCCDGSDGSYSFRHEFVSKPRPSAGPPATAEAVVGRTPVGKNHFAVWKSFNY